MPTERTRARAAKRAALKRHINAVREARGVKVEQIAEALGPGLSVSAVYKMLDPDQVVMFTADDLLDLADDSLLGAAVLAPHLRRAKHRAVPDVEAPAGRNDLLGAGFDLGAEVGEAERAYHQAVRDGVVTPSERTGVRREFDDVRVALAAAEAAMESVSIDKDDPSRQP
jgi:hypothetical protein